jgi:hypothetical protein
MLRVEVSPMTVLHDWSVKLAQEVAPAEAELAPLMAEAYAEGGESRRELFAESDSALGGFIPGGAGAVMPAVMDAVSTTAPVLVGALASRWAGEFLVCLKSCLEIVEVKYKADKARADAVPAAEEERGAEVPVAQVVQGSVPADATYMPLRRLIDGMSQGLQAQGMDPDQADLMTLRVLRTMFQEPQGAGEFVGQLSQTT